jgi:tRNA(Ile)-lysidine synthetase-like protein
MSGTGGIDGRAIERVVGNCLRAAGVPAGGTVLAAVSGGPDSTAMLRALASIRQEFGIEIAACAVDHGIRPAGAVEADISFVQLLCGSLGIPLIRKSVPPGECARLSRISGRSPEETARDLRHSLLREAAREAGASAIALGHTQDDVIETLLMRVIQGSDVHGLRGIPARRGPFVRPMLGCSRKQVLQYLGALGQSWRDDPSNSDTVFLRNRVRHRLVPVLDAEFPGFRTAMLIFSRKLALAGDLVRGLAARLDWTASSTRGYTIRSEELMAAHPSVRMWSLLRLYDRFAPRGAPRRLPWRFLSPVLLRDELPREGTLARGHGAVLAHRGGRFSWGPDIASREKKGYFMVASDARSAEIRGAGIHVSITRGTDAGGGGGGGIVILAGMVRPPIVLRSKRKGDSIRLSGGVTSVKDLLIGMKVPESQRDLVPILADRSGVLAVLGGALGYQTRARADILAGDRAGVDRMVVHVERSMEEGRE